MINNVNNDMVLSVDVLNSNTSQAARRLTKMMNCDREDMDGETSTSTTVSDASENEVDREEQRNKDMDVDICDVVVDGHHSSPAILYTELSSEEPIISVEMMDFSQVSVDVDEVDLLPSTRARIICTTTTAASNSINSSKSVHFGSIGIREYSRDLGDNPAVRSGVPIGLCWQWEEESTLDVDAYEEYRPPRRTREQLATCPLMRRQWMQHAGYSQEDINNAIKQANQIKYGRLRTNTTSIKLHEAKEVPRRLVRGLLNASIRRTQRQLERQQLESSLVLDQQRQRQRRVSSFTSGSDNEKKRRPRRTTTI